MHQDDVIERAIETFGQSRLAGQQHRHRPGARFAARSRFGRPARTLLEAVPPAVVKTRFATAHYEGEDEIAGYAMKRLGVPAPI